MICTKCNKSEANQNVVIILPTIMPNGDIIKSLKDSVFWCDECILNEQLLFYRKNSD